MSRSSIPSLAIPSSPLASTDGEVKRRKSHQWPPSPDQAAPRVSRPDSPHMNLDPNAPMLYPARAMLARRHSSQGVKSRIPRFTTGPQSPALPASSLSQCQGYFPPVDEMYATGERPQGATSPRSAYSPSEASDEEEPFVNNNELPQVQFENFNFNAPVAPLHNSPPAIVFNLNPFGVPGLPQGPSDVEIIRRPSAVTFQEMHPTERPSLSRTQSLCVPRPPSPYQAQRRGSAKWTDRLRSRPGSGSSSPALSRNPSFVEAMIARRPSLAPEHPPRSPQLTPSIFAGSRTLGSFSALYEGTSFYVKPTGRKPPTPGPAPQEKHGRYAHRVPRDIDAAIDFTRIRCPVPVPAGKAPILQHEEAQAALVDAYTGKSYGVVDQADPDGNLHDEGGSESDGHTVYSDVELGMNEAAGDAGYAYGDVPPAYEFSDPAIPCVIPDVGDVRLSPSEEQLLHHSMAHPWTTTPYNVTDRSGKSARATTWRSIQAAAGAIVVSALLVPFGAGFMVIEAGSFGVGSFGLLMVADFMFRVGAASLNRRRVERVTKTSTIANSHETYTTSPRLNRPRLPECSVTVVGYREDEAAWENCLESIKAQQYPVKHVVAVIDGNQLPDMAMACTFSNAFSEKERLVVHLPVLLSVLYTEKYMETLRMLGQLPTRYESFKAWWAGSSTAGHAEAHDAALNYVLDYVYTKATIQKWTQYRALCFTQPHAHKRHAMFTAFIVGTYALGTKDAILTTDSDTRLDPAAASNLMAMLCSDAEIAAVTGDVDVDRRGSSLANVYALNSWFSANVDAPCQSFFGSVSRLSSPMALYRVSDLMDVVSPWIMQTHFGKHVVTGEDRHLATELLSKGLKTAHTHAAKAYTDAPASYVRWIKQQTRWSRASYREALFSSPKLNNTNPWLAVEATKDLYCPLVLVASVLYLLFTPTQWEHLPIFLATIAGAVAVKTLYAVVASRDLRLSLYPVNQAMFFLGVVPSRVYALVTTYVNNWGTSARSVHEITRSECFYSRTKHVGHLLVWYAVLCIGLASYLATARTQPSLWLVAFLGPALALHAYADVFAAKTRFFVHAPRHLLQGRAKAFDIEAASPVAGRRSSIVKPLRKDSAYEDEQFEAQTAAIPLDPMRKGSVLYGDVMEKVFSVGDSRRPSFM